ncbi:hypothetical protein PMIN01_04966 [Paraphaeosphaeria minitans]|uniref:Uncharacterized protein n=1 Tax=Paraphaeosphaeria minitans TaxID=565426 RepID=A0A9P6GK85_9PLEO|nr:hypothetical protein PMIN01_04966 [Paraphaeosphaeria minitans]
MQFCWRHVFVHGLAPSFAALEHPRQLLTVRRRLTIGIFGAATLPPVPCAVARNGQVAAGIALAVAACDGRRRGADVGCALGEGLVGWRSERIVSAVCAVSAHGRRRAARPFDDCHCVEATSKARLRPRACGVSKRPSTM